MLNDLTYKVIVFDDEPELYYDYVEIMQSILEEQGYILEHERYEEMEDVTEDSIRDVDLFLVDLNFNDEPRGPEFIKKIREKHSTDILFYSSSKDAIRESRSKGEFEGVFFAVRDEHTDEIQTKIVQLLNKMIKRSDTPLAIRGTVLSCVAELDQLVKDKINNMLDQLDEQQQQKIHDDCTRIFYDSYTGRIRQISNYFGTDFYKQKVSWSEVKSQCKTYEISELIDDIHLTDSDKNYRVLLAVYELIFGQDDTYELLKDFHALLRKRNILAHARQDMDENAQYRFRSKVGDMFLTEDGCIKLRCDIKKYHEIIDGIASKKF
jgi:hypothetical protein